MLMTSNIIDDILFCWAFTTNCRTVKIRNLVSLCKFFQTGSERDLGSNYIIRVTKQGGSNVIVHTPTVSYILCLFASSSFFLSSQAATSAV